jgi:hypothetical protein
MPTSRLYLPAIAALFLLSAHAQTSAPLSGVPANAHAAIVHYQLPTDGPLPRTYLVTLAVADPKNPDWVIGNFASGVVRTVTAQNQGRFSETWDGLDDNYMPVVPGTYGVKGIYMPAQKWAIDGQYHAVIPKLAATGNSWGQAPGEDSLPDKIEGDPVGAPLADVDVAANGRGALAFEYLENGKNYFLADFTAGPDSSPAPTASRSATRRPAAIMSTSPTAGSPRWRLGPKRTPDARWSSRRKEVGWWARKTTRRKVPGIGSTG